MKGWTSVLGLSEQKLAKCFNSPTESRTLITALENWQGFICFRQDDFFWPSNYWNACGAVSDWFVGLQFCANKIITMGITCEFRMHTFWAKNWLRFIEIKKSIINTRLWHVTFFSCHNFLLYSCNRWFSWRLPAETKRNGWLNITDGHDEDF